MQAPSGSHPTRPASERLRFGLLVAVGVLLTHDSVFAAQYGLGDAHANALSATAHGYWPAFVGVTLLATIVGAGWAVAGLSRLTRLLRGTPVPQAWSGGYWREAAHLWPRLFLVIALVFALQENVEHLASGLAAPGLYVLAAPGYPLAIPVIAAVSGLLAAVGGWLRWRHETLVRRLRAARMSWSRALSTGAASTLRWRLVAALVAHGRILSRTDAGRAPPVPSRA